MFLLTRECAGFTYYLGVFDTEDAARRFERACRACHASGLYTYDVTRVAYNLRA